MDMGCIYLLVIANDTAMNMGVKISVPVLAFIDLEYVSIN